MSQHPLRLDRRFALRERLQLETDLDVPLPIQGDVVKLRQAFVNLLDNASRFTPKRGTIRLIGRREHGQAIVEVRDTGAGIAADNMPHLFEPFLQADRARSNVDHVGLGLSLASWIVHSHGGEIEATSQSGVGTAFSVSLPLRSTRAGKPA